jgi:uncharacterized membrane protein
MKEPFYPTDKPKSFVVFVSAVVLAPLAFGPILGLALVFKIGWLLNVGLLGFAACWAVGLLFGLVLLAGEARGRYKNLEHRKWRDQVW